MSKERLTIDEIKNGLEEYKRDCLRCREKICKSGSKGFYCLQNIDISVYEELKQYRDLEEKGLLLRLPVAVGSKVYLINSRYTKCTKYEEEFDEYSCQGCEDECDSHKEYYIHENKSVSAEWIIHNAKDFGETVFLTKSAAEEKLREFEGKEGGNNCI